MVSVNESRKCKWLAEVVQEEYENEGAWAVSEAGAHWKRSVILKAYLNFKALSWKIR